MRGIVQDLSYALRQMRRSPGVTAVAVLSLALGIGANTAILTLIESTLLRPIPVKHPDRLRLLAWHEQRGGWVPPMFGYRSPTFGTFYEQRETPDGGLLHTDFPPPLYRQFARDPSIFESLAGFKELGRVTLAVDGSAEAANCFLVSGEFYRALEITPVIGRPIRPEDDVPTQENQVAVISYEYWTRRFARNPSAIGKIIKLNEVPVTVIGVNPESFTGIEPGGHFEIWAPLHLSPAVYGNLEHGAEFNPQSERSFLDEDKIWSIPMLGRLRPGVSDAEAQASLDALFQAQVDANPGPLASFLKEPAKRPRFLLQSAARGVDYLTGRYDRLLLAVLSLAGVVLLIACANVANLLLAKSAVRRREISLRLALGAGHRRIARQLLTEGLLLAAMAGTAGVLFGYWTRNAIPSLLAMPWRPNPFDTTFDPKAAVLLAGITLLTGLLFSLAPMWQSRRVALREALQDGGRGTAGLSKLRLGRLLVVLQVALSVLLLVGAGLCVGTFLNLRNLPLGFQPAGVWLFTLAPPRLRYPQERMGALLAQVQERLQTLPGVQSATFSGAQAFSRITVIGRSPDRTFDPSARATGVGSHFFETMGIRILYGRAVDERDQPGDLESVVINRAFADHFFPDENPVGQSFQGSDKVTFRIVGVCADWRSENLRDPARPAFYSAWLQAPRAGAVTFELKVAGSSASTAVSIRNAMRSIDANLAVTDVRTEEQQIEEGLAQERLLASLALAFGGLALILASIGLYGVMAYAVARRTSEIGIRVALGARPAAVTWMILREVLALAAAGIVLGVPVVLAFTPILNHALAPSQRLGYAFGTRPNDPVAIALAVLILLAVGVFAGYFPARRAAGIDPTVALRHE